MALSNSDKRRIISSGIWIFLAALVIWLFSLRGQKHKQQIVDDQIKVGVDLSPQEFGIDSTGMVSGIQKELMKLLLPTDTFEWVPYSSRNSAIEALRTGEINIYATSLPYSISHEYEGIRSSEWLYNSSFSLLFNKQDAQWEDKFVGTEPIKVTISSEDKIAEILLDNLSELSYPAISVDIRQDSPVTLGSLLSKGEIQYFVCNSQLASSIVEKDSTLQISENFTIGTQQVWLFNHNDSLLLDSLNQKIIKLRDTKEWKEIVNKHLN